MIELEGLSPEENAKPWAKYYRPMTPPSPAHAKLLADAIPMDPAKALPIQRMNELLDPGYVEVETGYCTMPDGSGYMALLMPMPGVSADMVRWWMGWFTLDDLRYKIWSPRDHKTVSIKDEDRAMLLDPSVPRERKIQNPSPSHLAMEDLGLGVVGAQIDMLTPEELGFDVSRYRQPFAATMVGANVTVTLLGGGPPSQAVLVHLIRDIPGGIEYRTRLWMGYSIVDRKPVLTLPPGARIPEEAVWGSLEHDVLECENFRAVVPDIYAEFGHAIP